MALSAYSSPIPIIHIETLLRITARTNEFVATNALSHGSWQVVFTQLANPSGRHDSLFHALRRKATGNLSSPGTHAARDRSMADGTMPSIHGKEQDCGLLRLLFQMDDDET